ncbi:MAG TPA: 2-isopropylmalate synthase [Kofleriaceae bacterium]|nr:2-isopropylmalate synthase [Kofleriaceae bacterium]
MESHGIDSDVTSDGSYVRIFDTTLRDGEQAPGATMSHAEKLEVARALARLGVDVIEAGFPAASPGDLEAVRAIAREVGCAPVVDRALPPIICGLARATRVDIERAWEAVKPAHRPRIHTFLATSDLHLEHKLRMTRDQVLTRVAQMVAYAREKCDDVEFSPEDAGRSDPAFLHAVLAVAIEAGATTLNIPDTVGYTLPDEFGAMIAGIRANVPGVERTIISVHCHDDLGLAVANTLAGLRAGARQAEVAINGIGERAGNCSLEEVVMALRTRRPTLGLATGVDATQLTRISKLVSTCTGFQVPPNKAIVGSNAFAHESGIHQDGMLKHQSTYEIMAPEDVGATGTRLVLGKHSGRHAFAEQLAALGPRLDGEALDRAFERFKALADHKKHIGEADLLALASSERAAAQNHFALDGLQVGCGTMGMPTATVRLRDPGGNVCVHAAVGTGPVDAAFKAIDLIVGTRVALLEYQVHSVTEGIDALGQVSVRVRPGEATRRVSSQGNERVPVVHGYGADTDIVVASAKAYLAALNRVLDDAAAMVPPPPPPRPMRELPL